MFVFDVSTVYIDCCTVTTRRLFAVSTMAKTKYEYVREYEQDMRVARNNFIVLRIDGRGFHRFADKYDFEKPNDDRALNLMSCAGETVMKAFPDIAIAYGESDEYSFVFRRATALFERRLSKLISVIPSLFTSAYVLHWPTHFPSTPLKPCDAPSFDARATPYPLEKEIYDYLTWRQEDLQALIFEVGFDVFCAKGHINNLNNYCIWKLVQKEGITTGEAQLQINTLSKGDKNELLFSRFGINYNNLPAMHRKGTTLLWQASEPTKLNNEQVQQGQSGDGERSTTQPCKPSSTKRRKQLVRLNIDMNDAFWRQYSTTLE